MAAVSQILLLLSTTWSDTPIFVHAQLVQLFLKNLIAISLP
jgi:hypothetical protein